MGAQLPQVTCTTGTNTDWAAWTNYVFDDPLEDFVFAWNASNFPLPLAVISRPGKLWAVDGLSGKVPRRMQGAL